MRLRLALCLALLPLTAFSFANLWAPQGSHVCFERIYTAAELARSPHQALTHVWVRVSYSPPENSTDVGHCGTGAPSETCEFQANVYARARNLRRYRPDMYSAYGTCNMGAESHNLRCWQDPDSEVFDLKVKDSAIEDAIYLELSNNPGAGLCLNHPSVDASPVYDYQSIDLRPQDPENRQYKLYPVDDRYCAEAAAQEAEDTRKIWGELPYYRQ